jgi:hypothetical protein
LFYNDGKGESETMIYTRRLKWHVAIMVTIFISCLTGHRVFAQSASPTSAPSPAQGILSNFEHGLAPYQVCTTKDPNFVQAVKEPASEGRPALDKAHPNHVAKVFWTSDGYDETRMRRGAEACSTITIRKEGWYGFSFFLPSPGYPSTTTGAIAQIFQKGYCNSWGGMLLVRNGSLVLEHRGWCGAPDDLMIAEKVRYNAWNHLLIHFVASNEHQGLIEVWYNDEDERKPTARVAGINFGFAHGWKDDILPPDSPLTFKFGMYNFDDHHYRPHDTRTIYYDNVVQISGGTPNAWKDVSSASAMPTNSPGAGSPGK